MSVKEEEEKWNAMVELKCLYVKGTEISIETWKMGVWSENMLNPSQTIGLFL